MTPTPRPVYWRGDVQAANAAPSSEHWNVEPDSLEENSNVALVLVVDPVGPESIVVSGAVVSGTTVHCRLAGESSALPDGSMARTFSSCAPSARLV